MGNGTSIGRVRALGSAHSGTHHWLVQRYTAVGNLVLGLWLLFSLLGLPGYTYAAVHEWAARPLAATGLALFVLSTFWHARLGLQVVIEDYLNDEASKVGGMILLNLVSFAGAAFGLFCVIRIALGAH